MEFKPTKIPEVIIIEPAIHGDERGFFMETYQESEFSAAGIQGKFVQDNHSGSVQGTLRGLHYQIQQTQGKLVHVHRREGGRKISLLAVRECASSNWFSG